MPQNLTGLYFLSIPEEMKSLRKHNGLNYTNSIFIKDPKPERLAYEQQKKSIGTAREDNEIKLNATKMVF